MLFRSIYMIANPLFYTMFDLQEGTLTGKLDLVSYYNVDTSAVKGLWITCAASKSPWNTHLSSEEYEPDATLASNAQLEGFSQNLFGDSSVANPYGGDYERGKRVFYPGLISCADGNTELKEEWKPVDEDGRLLLN